MGDHHALARLQSLPEHGVADRVPQLVQAGPRGRRSPDDPTWLDETRSEEHTSELQSLAYLVCRLLLEKKKKKKNSDPINNTPNTPTLHRNRPQKVLVITY